MRQQAETASLEVNRDERSANLTDRVFCSSAKMLYLAGGSNGAAALHTEAGYERNVNSNQWNEIFESRRARIEALGSAFAQFVVPEKLTVYPLPADDLGCLFPGMSADKIVSPGRRLARAIGAGKFLYPEGYMREQAARFPIYPNTDSHWTWQGAFSAFQTIMSSAEYRPDYTTFVGLPKKTLRYHGDLHEARFIDVAPDTFHRICLPDSVGRIYANPMVGLKERLKREGEQGLHAGSHCIFRNRDASFRKTVILFGSSFSECRLDPSLLTAIFCFYFETVHFIWSTAVDLGYVARHKPDLTVAEMPERFLTVYPAEAQNCEAYAMQRLNAWMAKNNVTEVC